ncbi:MAG: transposase [Acidimicrobiales bacterium]
MTGRRIVQLAAQNLHGRSRPRAPAQERPDASVELDEVQRQHGRLARARTGPDRHRRDQLQKTPHLVVIVDHDAGNLVRAKPGRDMVTLDAFFDELGEERADKIKLVSADAADWIANWNAARKQGLKALAGEYKGVRFALWKKPQDLTAREQVQLSSVTKNSARLYRGYLTKEQFRLVLKLRGEEGIALLAAWLAWVPRCPNFLDAFCCYTTQDVQKVASDAKLSPAHAGPRIQWRTPSPGQQPRHGYDGENGRGRTPE